MTRTVYVSITVVAVVLGLAMAVQFRTTNASGNGVPFTREDELVAERKQLEKELVEIREEVIDLSVKLDRAGTGQSEANEVLEKELALLKRYAGFVPVSGPGVEVVLETPPKNAKLGTAQDLKNVTGEDLIKIVNSMLSAGAEAVSINGQRYLSISEIRLAGSHININATPLSPPYRVSAIGNAAALRNRLEIREGHVEFLRDSGVSVTLQIKEQVQIPAFSGAIGFTFAKPVGKI